VRKRDSGWEGEKWGEKKKEWWGRGVNVEREKVYREREGERGK
jgi:hypothetical protein